MPLGLWTRMGQRDRVLDGVQILPCKGCYWRHLANTVEPSMCGGSVSLFMAVVVAKPQSSVHPAPPTAAVSAKPPTTLPEEHRVLQDVFNQLVQLCTARASNNPVSIIIIIRQHRSTTYVDVACYRPSSMVCRSVCLSVTLVSPAKTAEEIKMFGLRTRA